MRRNLLLLVAATTASLAASECAQAQIVQVGPGYVRAPFVRVYTGPGGTQVLAPFVDVQAPGYRRGYVEQPAVPSAEELAQLDWANLRMALRELSTYFDSQLSTLSTGDGWKAHLKTAEIRALAARGDSPPTAEVVDKLSPILTAYDTTAGNPAYRAITGRDGFRGVRDALGEFLSSPVQRCGKQLVNASRELDRALAEAGAEAGWQKHLALPAGIAGGGPIDDVAPPGALLPSAEELAKALARFDAVSRNPQYRAIWQLPAFRVTQERLAEYLALAKAEQASRLPKPEELPIPR